MSISHPALILLALPNLISSATLPTIKLYSFPPDLYLEVEDIGKVGANKCKTHASKY
jgi:hypothetical protein